MLAEMLDTRVKHLLGTTCFMLVPLEIAQSNWLN
jgi:hypothetical protein